MSQPQFTFRFFFVKCTLHFTVLNINRVCQKYSSHIIRLIVCFTLCVWVLCLHVCVGTVYVPDPLEARRCHILWNWSPRWLPAVCELGIAPGSPEEVVSALNC